MAATGEENGIEATEKEGFNLLGSPTFTDLQNGRFRCVETGHELLEKDKESYSQSKRCRLGLIEYALSHKKSPLNLFKQDPNSRSKLICKLTGKTVNKSEEHIWKHINGKRFLNKLEEKEIEKESKSSAPKEDESMPFEENGTKEKKKKQKKEKKMKKSKTEKKEKNGENVADEAKDGNDGDGKSEEADFWMPPIGERWDFDEGGDRWDSASDSETNHSMGEDNEDADRGSEEISTGKKRKSEPIPRGLSSKEEKKKKKKKEPSSQV
ncbi:PREDICTED: protein PXR1 [Tarenaya hassleriana]|uniref:protein PXR1 n=1 Tax=Tarenaya hassleriana TaxID=28532 RepID=UPI00053C7798|nr:PREDICTED: protein PXR1 [Tarenaya hassleriana]